MCSIDLKDRRILFELDTNARQSLKQISKKVGVSKNAVFSRIEKLKEEGIIQNFYTVFNPYILGFSAVAICLKFQYANLSVKQKIIDFFVTYENSWYVSSSEGHYDTIVTVWVQEFERFFAFYNQFLQKYGKFIKRMDFRCFFQAEHYSSSYLLGEEYSGKERDKIARIGPGKRVEFDKTDIRIMQILAVDARISLTDIAKRVKCNIRTVRNRMSSLIKEGVIQAFRIGIDETKIGCKYVNVDVFLGDVEQKKKVLTYVQSIPCLLEMFTSISTVDLQLLFCVKNVEDVHEIMQNVSNAFPFVIKNYEYIYKTGLFKWNWIPGELCREV